MSRRIPRYCKQNITATLKNPDNPTQISLLHSGLHIGTRWRTNETLNDSTHKKPRTRLDSRLVGNRGDGLREVVLGGNGVGLTGLDGLALEVNVLALSLGLLALLGVGLDTVDELLARLGVLDVLNADIDALLHVAVSNTLVDDDTDGGLGDVVDDTGLAVEVLVAAYGR